MGVHERSMHTPSVDTNIALRPCTCRAKVDPPGQVTDVSASGQVVTWTALEGATPDALNGVSSYTISCNSSDGGEPRKGFAYAAMGIGPSFTSSPCPTCPDGVRRRIQYFPAWTNYTFGIRAFGQGEPADPSDTSPWIQTRPSLTNGKLCT